MHKPSALFNAKGLPISQGRERTANKHIGKESVAPNCEISTSERETLAGTALQRTMTSGVSCRYPRDTQRERLYFGFGSLILIQIPPPSIPESQRNANHHNPNRRKQQHQHRPIERPLALRRRALGIRVAHSAPLPKAGHSANTKHRQQRKGTNFVARKLHSPTSRPGAESAPRQEKRRST